MRNLFSVRKTGLMLSRDYYNWFLIQLKNGLIDLKGGELGEDETLITLSETLYFAHEVAANGVYDLTPDLVKVRNSYMLELESLLSSEWAHEYFRNPERITLSSNQDDLRHYRATAAKCLA